MHIISPPLPEPAGWRITDGEGGYNYSDEAPEEFNRAWAGRYGREHEPLFTVDQMRAYLAAQPAPAQPEPVAWASPTAIEWITSPQLGHEAWIKTTIARTAGGENTVPLFAGVAPIAQAQPTDAALIAPAGWDEIGEVLCSVADNLGDMPISNEWAAKTASRAWALLKRYDYFRSAPTPQQAPQIEYTSDPQQDEILSRAERAGLRYDGVGHWQATLTTGELMALLTQPQQAPLTDAQKQALWRATPYRGNGGQCDWFIAGIHAAERYYGIVSTPAAPGPDAGAPACLASRFP